MKWYILYSCDEGFVTRNPVATCGKHGTWESDGTRCDIVNCTKPADVQDGSFDNLGSTVSYYFICYLWSKQGCINVVIVLNINT